MSKGKPKAGKPRRTKSPEPEDLTTDSSGLPESADSTTDASSATSQGGPPQADAGSAGPPATATPSDAPADQSGADRGAASTPESQAPAQTGDLGNSLPPHRPKMARAVILPELFDKERRKEWRLPTDEKKPGAYMIELNVLYKGGLEEVKKEFLELYQEVLGAAANDRPAELISKSYFRCRISVNEVRELARRDGKKPNKRECLIYRVWPDFPVRPLIDHSVATVKADAAVRSYAATGAGIVWAVIDSGIDAGHIHFGKPDDPEHHGLWHPDVSKIHRDFTQPAPTDEAGTAKNIEGALTDGFGHGTHVAGIIAGGLPNDLKSGEDFEAYEQVYESNDDGTDKRETLMTRHVTDPAQLRGVAPNCKLVSLKVLDATGAGRASDVMSALHYIREVLNGDPKLLRVHGVNLSIGYEFDAEMFACGQSPLCVEVDRLVRSGVVVVVAAGNTGYGRVSAQQRTSRVGLSNTINDPGNAALAITVGATHRDAPHTYGVSYFSSKGPTGDGRLKPDLVAPGERITSCAAGRKLKSKGGDIPDGKPAYIDDTGTSMAAPHVSGAIAAFLSIRREFIQRPDDVKRIFTESATPLGRERYFEGHGLVDLMRAIQSV
jgi:serine protease AprX